MATERPSYCTACGARLRQGANFCPACGNQIEEEEDPETHVYAIIDELERVLAPHGSVVLGRDLSKRAAVRVEVVGNEEGALAAADQDRLLDAMFECIEADGYLYAEVQSEASVGRSLWHVINGVVVPLSFWHGEAIALAYATLYPRASRYSALEWIDAPDIVVSEDNESDQCED